MKSRSPRYLVSLLFCLFASTTVFAAAAGKPTLLELARVQFASTPLTEAEEKLFIATERGEEASMLSADETENIVFLAEAWPDNRVIRADALRWLCLNKEASERVTHRGLRVRGMRVDGDLNLSDAKLDFPIRAIGCAFPGVINLNGARTRSLDFSGCFLKMLTAHNSEIGGDIALTNGSTIEGEIDFSGATIAGGLNCSGSYFNALVAQEAKIAQSLDLREAKGRWVNLLGASIGGSIDGDGAELHNPGAWWSLLADRAKITGNVFLRRNRLTGQPFRAAGQVNFLGGSIGGSLECDGAELSEPPQEDAMLVVDRARITGHIFLREGFCCDGIADFSGAEAASIEWVRARPTNNTVLKLQSTKLGFLLSDNTTWPKAKNVVLDGLVYGRLYDHAGIDSGKLLNWLALQPIDQFHPQPYEQLALVLRTMGFERDARAVMIAKNQRHQDFTRPGSSEWWWYNVFGKFIGYGYLPSRAFFMSVGLIVLGAILFRRGYHHDLIMPTKESAYARYGGTPDPPGTRRARFCRDYPRFNAFVFSLEAFTPLLRLDQSSNWTPNSHAGERFWLGKWNRLTTGQWLRIYLWCHIIAGWILTSLWVGSITGLVKT